ncbi:Ribonuclease P protein component 2 [uncultured archaeon]|nr:Ribonuclease P protein component 2 [uncultured archaeon]
MRSRLPVLRTRRRYMAFELEAEGARTIQPKDLMDEIFAIQFSLFGESGAAANRIKLITFNGRRGLLRCHHQHLSDTRAVLAAICSIREWRVALHTKGVSGTIKAATEKYLPPLHEISGESDGRRIELVEISGCIIRTQGLEVDLCPDDRSKTKGSDTRYLGLTSFDLSGGHEHADGTADGL